jgi:hypothetical protein
MIMLQNEQMLMRSSKLLYQPADFMDDLIKTFYEFLFNTGRVFCFEKLNL